MKLAPYSDLHIEKTERLGKSAPLLPAHQADAIVLAGDIHQATRGLRWAKSEWPNRPILFTPGNHELYGLELFSALTEMREVAKELGIYLLINDILEIGNVRFIGTPLWTDFSLYATPEISAGLALCYVDDFRLILESYTPLTVATMARLHHEARAFLRSALMKPWNGKTVVITHWPPHPDCIPRCFRKNELSPYFCCDCSDLFEDFQIHLWVFGHSHGSCDMQHASGCRLISNQRGHPLEKTVQGKFRPDLLIDI